ncbi:hypothetical protein BDZ89DRAFT_1079198 [Hymenopellis radicata]|nr:hypothetical protein BDZ89DRAFT_1079198 [Hymenopellis radicata]
MLARSFSTGIGRTTARNLTLRSRPTLPVLSSETPSLSRGMSASSSTRPASTSCPLRTPRSTRIKAPTPSLPANQIRCISLEPATQGNPDPHVRYSSRKTVLLLYLIPATLFYQLLSPNSVLNTYFLPTMSSSLMIGAYTFHTFTDIYPSSPYTTPRYVDLDSFESTRELWMDIVVHVYSARHHLQRPRRCTKPHYTDKIPQEERHAMMRDIIEDVLVMCRDADGQDVRAAMSSMYGTPEEKKRTRISAPAMFKLWWLGTRISTRVVASCLAMEMRALGMSEPMGGEMVM